jgi:hypothetical protein
MTLEELKFLNQGEVVVFTKVDERICEYHNHSVGDEMLFLDINDDVVNFLYKKNSLPVISHFTYEICHYIERKIVLERQNKLNQLGL